jgi:hypothetical protein
MGLAVVAAAAVAGWIYLSPGPSADPPRIPPKPPSESAPSVSLPVSPTAAAPAPVVLPSAAPSVVLSGVVVGADGGNLAIVSVDRRPERMVRVGDDLANATTVERIDDDSMTYRFAGQQRRVEVQSARNVAATAKPEAPPKPLPGFVVGAPTLARADGAGPGSGNDRFRQAVARKTQAIASGN